MKEPDRAAPARQLIQHESHGVLCTISQKVSGWPFGSVTPYALGASGEPIILISELAEHTRNLRADPRVSLFIQDSAALADPQTGARITLMGRATPVAEAETTDARRRYLKRFPQSAGYFQIHDFTLFKLAVEKARFIGGFGEIYWLEPSEILMVSEPDPLAPFAAGICEHMNTDHADALMLYCQAFAGVKADTAKMMDVDAKGFQVMAERDGEQQLIRIAFPESVSTADEVRQTMISLLKQARTMLAAE